MSDFDNYDPGYLNGFGGGNVSWWMDYIRCEVDRCNDFWRQQTGDCVESENDFQGMGIREVAVEDERLSNRTIRVTLRGRDADGGDVRFNDFIKQLEAIKKAIKETSKLISNKPFSYLKITDLSHQSPATIELSTVARSPRYAEETNRLVDDFFSNLDLIESGRKPRSFTYGTFMAYKGITNLRDQRKISEIVISRNGSDERLLPNFSSQIEDLLGKDLREIGQHSGRLEYLNLHSRTNIFYLYPTPTSRMPRLKCRFSEELKNEVISSIDQYVTVFGKLKYKPGADSSIPYEMVVNRIKRHGSGKDLPILSKLEGIFPEATGNIKSEDFIRGIRDEW